MVDYAVDLFMTLDGFGSGREVYWGKDDPELREERARAFGERERALLAPGLVDRFEVIFPVVAGVDIPTVRAAA